MNVKKGKWLVILVAVAMLMALVPAIGGAQNGNGDECGLLEVRLMAGQHIHVGSVTVTNDDENICVTYELNQGAIDEGWEITETHLYIGKNEPPTSAPGQFPYDDDDAEYDESTVTYCIPLDEVYAYKMQLNPRGRPTGVMIVDETTEPGVEHCNDVFIAAHAVIEREECEPVSGTITPTLTWSRSSEETPVANFSGYGADWTPAQGFAIPTPLTDTDLVWDGGELHQYFTGYSTRDDVSWASWDYAATDPRGGNYNGYSDLRRFNATFTLSSEVAANITSATLKMPDFDPDAIPINDNIYIFLNGEDGLVFWGGTRVAGTGAPGGLTEFQGMPGVPAIATYQEPDWGGLDFTGWYIPGQFPNLDIANFAEGLNNLDVFTEENDEGGGMAKLALTLGYAYDDCTTYDETAWGKGENFGTNWAMYFKHHICVPPDIVRFPVDGTAYIGYEDRLSGSDFDYNDFGMNMELEETYLNGVLESISMKFTSVVNRAGDVHDIHIARPLSGDYTYTITRSDATLGSETAATTDAAGSGNFDIVLFDTVRWPNNDSQVMGQWVEIEITMAEGNVANLLTDYTAAPRWDLDEVFSLYNPYMYNSNMNYDVDLNSSDTFLGIPNVPLILVVPYTDWPAPGEGVAITTDYPYFEDYYKTQDPQYEEWYVPGFTP